MYHIKEGGMTKIATYIWGVTTGLWLMFGVSVIINHTVKPTDCTQYPIAVYKQEFIPKECR